MKKAMKTGAKPITKHVLVDALASSTEMKKKHARTCWAPMPQSLQVA